MRELDGSTGELPRVVTLELAERPGLTAAVIVGMDDAGPYSVLDCAGSCGAHLSVRPYGPPREIDAGELAGEALWMAYDEGWSWGAGLAWCPECVVKE